MRMQLALITLVVCFFMGVFNSHPPDKSTFLVTLALIIRFSLMMEPFINLALKSSMSIGIVILGRNLSPSKSQMLKRTFKTISLLTLFRLSKVILSISIKLPKFLYNFFYFRFIDRKYNHFLKFVLGNPMEKKTLLYLPNNNISYIKNMNISLLTFTMVNCGTLRVFFKRKFW
jgi:hypothetical protein